ncbi:MAG TPA: recombinase family protein, partial [Humisphaera sp.]|nr:recombinase family protein [Humisphaera sp.]
MPDYRVAHICRKQKAALVIAKLDRLARNVAFISALLESKVKFVATDMPEADTAFLQIVAAFAEWEAKNISERTKSALAAARARGKVGQSKTAAMNSPNALAWAARLWSGICSSNQYGFCRGFRIP